MQSNFSVHFHQTQGRDKILTQMIIRKIGLDKRERDVRYPNPYIASCSWAVAVRSHLFPAKIVGVPRGSDRARKGAQPALSGGTFM
jgi:hypothetical protein